MIINLGRNQKHKEKILNASVAKFWRRFYQCYVCDAEKIKSLTSNFQLHIPVSFENKKNSNCTGCIKQTLKINKKNRFKFFTITGMHEICLYVTVTCVTEICYVCDAVKKYT